MKETKKNFYIRYSSKVVGWYNLLCDTYFYKYLTRRFEKMSNNFCRIVTFIFHRQSKENVEYEMLVYKVNCFKAYIQFFNYNRII